MEYLERDFFESNLVADEYAALKLKLLPLKERLEKIIFYYSDDANDTKEIDCQNQVEFNLIPALSINRDTFFFNKYEVDENSIINRNENSLSFSLVGMTNIYLFKKKRLINPSISLGVGANFQGSKIALGGFLGGGISFGKKRLLGINFGLSYLPIRALNPAFSEGQQIDMGLDESLVFREDYRWSTFVSLALPINRIFNLLSPSSRNSESHKY